MSEREKKETMPKSGELPLGSYEAYMELKNGEQARVRANAAVVSSDTIAPDQVDTALAASNLSKPKIQKDQAVYVLLVSPANELSMFGGLRVPIALAATILSSTALSSELISWATKVLAENNYSKASAGRQNHGTYTDYRTRGIL